ncbi:uncharacterized protein LOC124374369 [Homalodisca vitripennis]|nr:uncharacterized protein LOC124374369 [Homalodisca vitripennis]
MYEFLPRQRKLKHILQARNMNEINVIHEELVPEILKTSSDLENSRLVESNYQQIPSMIDSVNVISQQERYEIALSKTQRLANLLSEAPSETFFQRLVNLETLIYNWENNEEIKLTSAITPMPMYMLYLCIPKLVVIKHGPEMNYAVS